MKFLNRFRRKNSEPEPSATQPEEKAAQPSYSPEVKQQVPQRKAPPNPDELRFELGDFLHRIPSHLLQSGPHDLKTEICFEIKELSERIAKGQTTISLSEIYKRVPQIFNGQILDTDNVEIRFPWQKLARLVNSVRVDPKNALSVHSGVGHLADRLRQKKDAPGESPHTESVFGQSGASGPSVLPGFGSKQSAWFSKPTFDNPPEKPQPAPKPPRAAEPISAPAPATEAADTQPLLKLVAAEQATPSPLKSPSASTPQVPKISAAELNVSDLPVDVARRVAMIKGDFERQLAELERQRKAAADAQEQNANQVEKFRQELEHAKNQLSSEQSASSASFELLQKSTEERQHLEQELEAQRKKVEELQSRLAAAGDASKYEELVAERDALLQQKAYLASQVAEVSKRGHPARLSENGGTAIMGAQRQVEELQRRIGTLEASQRENALIISREKELRAKAEKLLAAAEKLQEQSANHMESAKAEMRKEIEVSFRQRENEARKAQKELQEQLTALSDQTRKSAVELENARARAAELEAQLEQTKTEATPQPDPLQGQLIVQLEDDIQSYRERLKSLITERDAARAEAANLAVTPKDEIEKITAEKSKLETELNEVRKLQVEQAAALALLQQQRANDQQRADDERAAHEARAASLMDSIQSAQQSFSEKRASLEPALAEAKAELEALRSQYKELSEKFQSEQENFEKERQQTAANLREQSLALEQQLGALVRERDQLRKDKDALAVRIKSEAEAREDLITGLDREHTSVVRANQELTKRLADTERLLRDSENERARLVATGGEMTGDEALQSEVAALRAQLSAACSERDTMRADAQKISDAFHENETALTRLSAEHQRAVAVASEEQVVQSRLQEQIETLRVELQTNILEKENAHVEIARLRQEISATAEAFAESQNSANGEIVALTKAKVAIEAQQHAEMEKLTATLQEKEAAVASANESQRVLRESLAASELNLNNEIAKLQAELVESQNAQRELMTATERERAQFAAEAENAQRQISEIRSTSEQSVRDLEQKLTSAEAAIQRQDSEFEKLRTALAAARHDYDELAQRAAIEKSGFRQQIDSLTAATESLADELTRERENLSRSTAAQNEALKQASEDLARIRQELAGLQAERENLIRQRDELTRRLTRASDDMGVVPTESESARVQRSYPYTSPVIEVLETEITFPERENGVSRPRIRPVPIAPPKIGSL